MKDFHHRLQETVLSGLWKTVSTYPRVVLGVALALTLVSGLYAWVNLRMTGDTDRMVSPDLPYQKTHLENLRNFGDQEYLYVVVETGGTEAGRQQAESFVESMAAKLSGHTELIQEMFYRITPDDLGDVALQLVPPEEMEHLTRMVESTSPFIDAWLRDRTLSSLLVQVSRLFQEGQRSLVDLDSDTVKHGLDGLARFAGLLREVLDGKGPTGPILDLDGAVGSYLEAGNGRYLIMKLLPAKDFTTLELVDAPLKLIRDALRRTRAEFPGVSAGLTGRPALQADEMETTNRDMMRASVASVLLVATLFVFVLHGWLRPVLILVTLGMAIAWTFGFAAITVGELNLLSVVFALVLVGIGVDYGVHIVMRFLEATQRGASADEAVRTAICHTGPGVVLGVATTVCAFYAVLGSDFKGLAELGLIGGTGILLALVAMMTVLPAMLLLAGRRGLFPVSSPRITSLPFLRWFSDRPRGALLMLVLVSIIVAPGLRHVRFDYNLLKLQSQHLESVIYEKRLTDSADESTWFAVLTANSLEGVKDRVARAQALPTVGSTQSILDFLPQDSNGKSPSFADLRSRVNAWTARLDGPSDDKPGELVPSLERLNDTLEGLSEKLFVAGAGPELASVEHCLRELQGSLDVLKRDPGAAARLIAFWNRVLVEAKGVSERIHRWVAAGPVSVDRLPQFVKRLFIGEDGRFQVKVLPKADIWDFANLQEFVSELRGVDPQASGVPVVVLESAFLMHRTFLSAAALTVVLVCLMLWLYARSVRFVLLAMVPLGVGVLWLLELMGWLGIDFNLANFFAIPMLIAVGVDGGVHLLDRWDELGGQSDLFSTSTPTAVASSYVTTIMGFGGLLFADHGGLASLGAVMVLGSVTGMIACLLVLPCALRVFDRRVGKQRISA